VTEPGEALARLVLRSPRRQLLVGDGHGAGRSR
jgi:hypothetical protein